MTSNCLASEDLVRGACELESHSRSMDAIAVLDQVARMLAPGAVGVMPTLNRSRHRHLEATLIRPPAETPDHLTRVATRNERA